MGSASLPPYLLSIDGGTESVRAAIFDLRGHLLASAAQAYATDFPRAGWAQQNPDQWWSALCTAVRECVAQGVAQGTVRAGEIRGISLDATSCTLVALDKNGSHLRPALLWMDVRAAPQAARIFATRHPALSYSPQGCNAEWMLSKTLWLAENEPETYARSAHLIEYTDWLIYRLTGRLALSLNTITQRWYYNGRTWHWPVDLYDRLGLGGLPQKLPGEILPVGAEAGCLTGEAAAALGLGQDVRVFGGGADAFVGLLGLNVAQPGKIGLITGSSNVIGAFVADEFHGSGLFGAFPDAVVPGLWLVEAGQVSTGSILAWFKRNFAADLPSGAAYKFLDAQAAQVPPGSGGLVTLDHFQGNRTPYTDSKARGAIWGLSLHTSRADMFRALMEGVAYGTRQILETLAGYGQAAGEVYVCGGATRSEVFMQIYADVCGLPMSVTEVPDAPLLADAIVAATGLGAYSDLPTAAEAMVRLTRSYTPDPTRHGAYAFYFERYCETYGQLRDLIHQTSDHESAEARAA
jgi:FGGY-family pentulose kinase